MGNGRMLLAKMSLPKTGAVGWQSLAIQIALVSVAAGLTWVTQHVSGTDFGQYTALIVAGATIALNYVNSVIQNNPGVNVNPSPAPVVNPDSGGVDFPI